LVSLTPDAIGVLFGVALIIPNASSSVAVCPGLLNVRVLAARLRMTFMPIKSLTSPMSRTSNLADTKRLTASTPSSRSPATIRSSTYTRIKMHPCTGWCHS